MSQMNSPEWLRDGGQHNPEHTKMHTGQDENVHVVHHTNVRDQAREQEH